MVSFWQVLKSKLQHKPLAANITLKELKDLWAEEHYKRLTPAGISGYEYAWSKIPQEMRETAFLDLKWADWQAVVTKLRSEGRCFYVQKRIKNICGQMYKFAIRHELCEKNYAPLIEMGKNIPVREKCVYTDEEIQILLNNRDDDNVKMILLLIFTGVRISELLRIKPSEDVFLDDKYFIVRKSKTVAGTNRPIPIHNLLLPIFKYFMDKGNMYLLTKADSRPFDYRTFRYYYQKTLRKVGFVHTIHECRHTFASLLDDVDANDMCIRRMLGHAGVGVTKKVYTHKNMRQLFEAMSLLEKRYQ